jgi:hypothetical protein
VTPLLTRVARAFRAIPTARTGPVVATVVSALVALGIAGPLIYRAIDDDGGGGDSTASAEGSEPDRGGGSGKSANGGGGNSANGGGEPGVTLPSPGGGDGTGAATGDGSGGGGGGGGDTGSGTDGATSGESTGSVAEPPAIPTPTLPPPTTSPTTNPPPQPEPVLLVSNEATREGAVPLDGAQLGGLVHPFVDDPKKATDTVAFFWDDPTMQNDPITTDPDPEFDFCGTAPTGLAIPFNTQAVPNGSHQMTVKVKGNEGTVIVLTATIDINNVIPRVPPPVCGSPVPG